MIIISTLGLIIGGIYTYNQSQPSSPAIFQNPNQEVAKTTGVTRIKIQPSPTIVQPTMPPLSETVKAIDDKMITVYGKSGDLLLPKNPNNLKVFKRSATGLIEATYDDLKIGQPVTFEIVPNKYAQIIIESR